MSRYTLMETGVPHNEVKFKDPLSLVFKTRVDTFAPTEMRLTQSTATRFDRLVENEYGDPDYEFLILWLNGKSCSFDLQAGDVLNLHNDADLSQYLKKSTEEQR